jgi:hypothetical protein
MRKGYKILVGKSWKGEITWETDDKCVGGSTAVGCEDAVGMGLFINTIMQFRGFSWKAE